MLDVTSAKASRLLSVTEMDIEQRKAIAGLDDDHNRGVTSLKSMIEQRADHCARGVLQSTRQGSPPPPTLCSARCPRQAKPRTRGSP